ncbi:uncharacterized protein EMH_0030770 [Eimeria mitis]|uniref:Uncharacterized protein n=1 Tax=Eimeria mitis TaxID=44415 RepID=U6JPD8_9EIME|nr:uncharacterized protein EMH_0030770 [Eimeria mitis]CDJ27324.1 hypothetical protein, conserved [Eimeria mitis]
MAAVLLLLHWLTSSMACAAAPLLLSVQPPIRSLPPPAGITAITHFAEYSGGAALSFLLYSSPTASSRATPCPPSSLYRAPSARLERHCSNTQLFACRPRPKKEKARRNYRIAMQQKQKREERQLRRRQQLEIFKAHQRLLLASEGGTDSSSDEEKHQKQRQATASLFSIDGPLLGGGDAVRNNTNNNNSSIKGIPQYPLAARINYRLVGGTWRRAKGQAKYVKLSGAELAAAVFAGLPEEEVAAAVAKAKRQDEGFMDLEAYDESGTQHTTLEGLN